MPQLLIRDLTLRDGQQSLFATRMTQSQVDRVLPYFKTAGFYAMEVWGGAVPDSVMRFLNENPWERLEKIKEVIGDSSKLTALSRGRNLFGYNPYPEQVIEGFNRNAVKSGVDIMRIFDALNDISNLESTIRYVKENNGIADGAICYTVDPKFIPEKRLFGLVSKHKKFKPVFTTEYFVEKAKLIESLGADMITVKDMAGLISPTATKELITALKNSLKVPVDFHTHCTPGFGLASTLTAIINGVDIVDTNIWTFAGGPSAPAFELIWIFCKKLGIEINVDLDSVAAIDKELIHIRRELDEFDSYKKFPRLFDIRNDVLPAEIEKRFDDAIENAQVMNEEKLLAATQSIEEYFGFPAADEKVRNAEIPGGMYTNMLTQLKQLGLEDLLDRVLETVPEVRLDAGCPPLVTPTSQIVGVQAVNCVIDENKGLPRYTNNNTQFVNLVKGNYGKTPVPVNPEFREKITGSSIDVPYDTSKYQKQLNPVFPEYNDHHLAENEKEELLLELFPNIAAPFLKKRLENTFGKEIEEERQRLEEEHLKDKLEYDSMSPEQRKERLLEGLYNYNWFSFMDNVQPDDEESKNDVKK
jgi:pyruvate/oxaloacetate carboxyltransferase